MVAALDNSRMQTALGRRPDCQDPAVARQAAARLLAELFFKPLLAEMRQFPLGRDLATGGQTESIFEQRLDERIADTVAGASPGLTDSVQRYFERRANRPTPGADRAQWLTKVKLGPRPEVGGA